MRYMIKKKAQEFQFFLHSPVNKSGLVWMLIFS